MLRKWSYPSIEIGIERERERDGTEKRESIHCNGINAVRIAFT